VLSLFDGLTKISSDSMVTFGTGESGLKDAFTSLGAEKGINQAAVDLYRYCKSFLLGTLNGQANEEIPTGLVLEEIGNILDWFQVRQRSLSISDKPYKLGDENFFGLKILHDVERNGRFGILFSGGINLDSRGSDELWLSIKLYNQGSVIYESSERPIGTLDEKQIGRLVVDRFEQFIDYSDLEWSNDIAGKVATVTAVASVIDRTGKMCFSSRLVESCRVISTSSKDQIRLDTDAFGWADSLLKGHKLENIIINNHNRTLTVKTDCTVLNYPKQSVILSVKVLDGYQDQIASEEFALNCTTRIAKFYDIQSQFVDPIVLEEAKVIEIVLTDEQNKVLAVGSASL
jgi:hypothetical protein